MTILFFIFVGLVIFHFVVEGIIAPSERHKVRLDLFALRDEIRREKVIHGREFNDELYDHMQEQVNRSIYLLHNYNLVGLFQAMKPKNRDPKIRERVERFYELLYDSGIECLQAIHVKSMFLTAKGFVYNSLGWSIYLLPLFVFFWGIDIANKIYKSQFVCRIKEWFGSITAALLELPENRFNRYFPPSRSF